MRDRNLALQRYVRCGVEASAGPASRWPADREIPMKLTIRYDHVSIALDIAAAGIGALGGPLNAMTAVIGKRGLESALRHSARMIADWRNPPAPQPAPEPEVISPTGPESAGHEERGERRLPRKGQTARVRMRDLVPLDLAAS